MPNLVNNEIRCSVVKNVERNVINSIMSSYNVINNIIKVRIKKLIFVLEYLHLD